MSWVIGIDGCPAGWLAAGQKAHGGPVKFEAFSRLEQLDSLFPNWRVVGIDMPIGLSDHSRRKADQEARTFVGPRRSSVFPSPIRPVLQCLDHESGCALSKEIAGFRFPVQTWHIVKRIFEVDEFIGPEAVRSKVFEIHPEVSFAVMRGDVLPSSKKCDEGQSMRRELLHAALPGAYFVARDLYLKKHAANDDILDSLAALWSAWRILEGRARFFPSEPFEVDSAGRRMVIAA